VSALWRDEGLQLKTSPSGFEITNFLQKDDDFVQDVIFNF